MRNVAHDAAQGPGHGQGPQKGRRDYLRAAEAGLPTAQADLADMYLKGEAGPPDLARALPLLEAAAAANHPVAQYQLGQMYETGAPAWCRRISKPPRQLYAAAASHGMQEASARRPIWGRRRLSQATTASAPAAAAPARSARTALGGRSHPTIAAKPLN